jgi:hypothetical protein
MTTAKRTLKVIILDDETNMEAAIASKLPKAIGRSSSAINPNDITSVVKELGSRAAAVRSSRKYTPKELQLDSADLFIVDYDLVKAKNEDYLTGETVAYLARCYSGCGVVVALNQFYRQPTFDLTLRPQLDSFADLNIAADDLKNSGLWTASPWKGYRPWSWPVVTDLISLLGRRIQDVEKANPKMRVVDFFDLPTSAIERLPTAALELLGSQESKADAATLSDVLRSPDLGLRGREATDRKRQLAQDARIVAARLSAWLNLILAPQDVLVDAPHLAQRCPSLIAASPTAAALNKTCTLGSDKSIFRDPALAKTKFKKHYWFDRPVWLWTEIERLRLTEEIKDPWHSVNDRFVFCEDTSSFKGRSAAKSFQSDLVSPYRTRFVSRIARMDYQPAHRPERIPPDVGQRL